MYAFPSHSKLIICHKKFWKNFNTSIFDKIKPINPIWYIPKYITCQWNTIVDSFIVSLFRENVSFKDSRNQNCNVMFVLDIEIRKDDPCHLYSVKSKPLLPFPLMDYKQIIIFFLPANTNSPNMAINKSNK